MTDWRLKIFAYLHDPPDKPLALGRAGGHAAWGRELAGMLGAAPAALEAARWDDLVARADRLAAGADRTGLLPRVPVTLAELRHPLSGEPIDLVEARLDLRDAALRESAERALREEVGKIREATADDPQAAFLALWGILPERLRARPDSDPPGRELRGAWDLLPAETRMPNHPVPAHDALVSALTTVLAETDRAAALTVTIGPVQRFIVQARRTSDLWAGSVLLAQAVLHAVRPVVEALGPDHVIFPVLRSSGAFLGWLLDASPWAARLRPAWPAAERPAWREAGGLPNRFVAVVPAGRARELAERCEAAVMEWWEGEVGQAAKWLEDRAPDLAGYTAMAVAQARGHLRVTWAASPWPLAEQLEDGGPASAEAAWLRNGALPDTLARYLEVIRAARDAGTDPRPFGPNGGLLYTAAYDGVERLVGAVKGTPRAVPRDEGGLKCSLCGERAVVPAFVPFAEQKARWGRVREALGAAGHEGLLRRGEALCGVCWAKRRFGMERRAPAGIPSTAEIAASPFKRAVLQKLDAGKAASPLVEAVRALCDEAERDGRFAQAFVVPALVRNKSASGLAGRFARVEGEVLLTHPREDRDPDERPVPPALIRAAAHLRKVARKVARQDGIAPPRPYLAVLVLDGDEMGKWLSGEKALPLRRYLARGVATELEAELAPRGLATLLDTPWPMTPALHAAFSEACGVFSQRTARRTVEAEDALGVLVYAGGDDVLALLPAGFDRDLGLEPATETARRLRFRFSGHVRRADGGDTVAPEQRAGFVLDRHGLGLALGARATASAGIAVFHQRWPLGRALEAARRAEEFAKEALGRDALGLTLLRRSGQTTVTGLGFREREGPLPELLELALPIACEAAARHAEPEWAEAKECFLALARATARRDLTRAGGESGASESRREADGPAGSELDGATGDPVASFAKLVAAFSETGPLSPRLVSELGLRLGPLAAEAARHPTRRAAGEGAASREDDATRAAALHLDRWLDLIEAAAFLGRGGEA
jgi:CRISPR-associated protein Cmr2